MKPTIVRQDGPAGRFYLVDGVSYPSVTHILSGGFPKPALMYWAANLEREAVSGAAADLYLDFAKEIVPPVMPRASYLATLKARLPQAKAHQKALALAGDVGTAAHDKVEWWLRTRIGAEAGPEPVVPAAAEWACMSFQDWARSVSLKVILIEKTVVSKVHGFAGTMDLLARVNGVPTLIDLKTGKQVYGEAHLQSAAYQTALVEMGYLPPAGGGLIVRLPKVDTDPAFEVVPVPPVAELLPTFLACKQVWSFTYQQDEAYRARTKQTKVA